jgi:hypothetical protein
VLIERRRAEWLPWPERHLTLDAIDPPVVNLRKALEYHDSNSASAGDRVGL